MRSLFRYVLLKSTRERFLAHIVIGPALLIGAPVFGLMVRSVLRSRPLYPFVLDGMTPQATVLAFMNFAVLCSAMAGGVAAFWVFRQEIADRSIASFVLAARPTKISVTAWLYGVGAAMISFLIIVTVIAVLTLSVPPRLGTIVTGLIGAAVFASASSVLLAAVSPDPGMLLPMLVVGVPMTIMIVEGNVTAMRIAVFAALILPIVAGLVLERRCAG